MKKFFGTLLLFSCAFASEHQEWLQSVLNRADIEGATQWLKEELHKIKGNEPSLPIKEEGASKRKCYAGSFLPEKEPTALIFISFSVPEATWKSLSNEAEKFGAIFVLKGLPNNSFLEFAKRLKKLREQGIKAPLQIHPILFEKYRVDAVPAFVFIEGEVFDKVVGSVSLKYALEQIETHQSDL